MGVVRAVGEGLSFYTSLWKIGLEVIFVLAHELEIYSMKTYYKVRGTSYQVGIDEKGLTRIVRKSELNIF